MAKITRSADGTAAYIEERSAAVSLGNPLGFLPTGPDSPASKPVVAEPDNSAALGNISPWGTNNLFPQDVLKEAFTDPFIHPLIKLKTGILYGSGVEIVAADYDENGNEVLIRDAKAVPDLAKARAFHKSAGVDRYVQASTVDFYWFYNIFPELIMSKDHSEIVNISRLMAKDCRWRKRSAGEMVSSKCYVSGKWDNGGTEENSIKIDTIDPYNFPVETLKEKKTLKKFIFPCSYPDPERPYYALAPWNVYLTSQWSNFVKKIPEFKSALMKNQMLVRWHIEISTEYWPWKYGNDWEKWGWEKRNTAIDETLTDIDEKLAGSENAGKALLTHNVWDNKTQSHREMIKITKLDDKVQTGAYIEDSAEGSSFAIFTQGLHPTIVGHAPGSGSSSVGAGSGSDQRVAWNNYLYSCQMEKDIIFAPLHFIRDYNGWDDRIQWRFKQKLEVSTDVNKEPQQMSN